MVLVINDSYGICMSMSVHAYNVPPFYYLLHIQNML